ncbi:MAG: IS3 family transposase [Nevskiales bacterium]
MRRPRRNHSAAFKAKVALAAARGDKTMVELAEQFDLHANQITQWKAELLERAVEMFSTPAERAAQHGPSTADLQAKIGQLTMEIGFFRSRAQSRPRHERKAMICRDEKMPMMRQCQILALPRSTAYYCPVPVPQADLALMRRMDALHLDFPFAGSRMLRDLLRLEDHTAGRKRVARLMRLMGIEALYRKRNTSRRHPAHAIFKYRLRGLTIDRPNQVWAMDITYLPMKRGFVYLAVVLDWATRRILSFRLSNSLTTDFCIEAVEEAIAKYGKPGIFNTDQGCQFTSSEFVALLKGHGIQISMDGKGCWRDNVFVERLWKTIKYEEVYLHAYETVSDARARLTRYIRFYNTQRPHSSLDGQTPDTAYFKSLPQKLAA